MKVADKSMERVKALPAANASAVTDSVDLGAAEVGPVGANLDVVIEVEATTTLVDTYAISLTLEDSADNSTFAPVVGGPTYTVIGVTGNGSAAASFRGYLPPNTRRYLRAKAAIPTSAGSNIAKNFALKFKV